VHEMSIAQSLLEIVLEQSREHRLQQIRVIRLQIGEMAAVVPESLSFCFELLSKDTVASGAALEIETLPVVARCAKCRIPFQVEDHMFVCPECGEPTFEMISGRELSLASIEGESVDNNGTDQDSSGSEHSPGQ
jgi:hydrogenase nickel incorporation protein HypA/HybF